MQVSDALTGTINLPSAGLEVGDLQLISRIRLGSSVTEVTFGGIPQNFADLQIRGSVTMNGATNQTWIVNGDTTSGNYRGHHLWGTGSGSTNTNNQSGTVYWNYTPQTSYPSPYIMYWYDYTSTTKTKTMLCLSGSDTNSGTTDAAMWSGFYSGLSAITSITLKGNGASFTAGSVFSLYGIRN
jgi:hypothetical protein